MLLNSLSFGGEHGAAAGAVGQPGEEEFAGAPARMVGTVRTRRNAGALGILDGLDGGPGIAGVDDWSAVILDGLAAKQQAANVNLVAEETLRKPGVLR